MKIGILFNIPVIKLCSVVVVIVANNRMKEHELK